MSFYTLLGFVLVPYFIQSNFTKIISEQLNTQGYLKRIYFNPYTFELKLENLLILDDSDQSLLYFRSLYLNINWSNITSKEIIIDQFLIDGLKTSVDLYKEKKFNFSHILTHLEQSAHKKEKEKEKETDTVKANTDIPLTITLQQLLLSNTQLIVTDHTKTKPFELKTKPFNFEVRDFSTQKNKAATIRTNIEIENTLLIGLNAFLELSPLKLQGNLTVQDIQLNRIFSYLKEDFDFVFGGVISYLGTDFQVNLSDQETQAHLRNIALTIPKLSYSNQDFAIMLNEFKNNISSVKLHTKETIGSTLHSVEDIKIVASNIDLVDKKKDAQKHFSIKDIVLGIDKFSSDSKNISQITLSLNTPESGSLHTKTDLKLTPFKVDSVVALQDFTLRPYKEYIKDFVNLDLKETYIDIKSKIQLTQDTQTINATTTLSDINIFHNLTQKQLLEVKTLTLSDLQYTNNNLVIESVVVDSFTTAVKIAADKTTNIDHIMIEKEEPKKESIESIESIEEKPKASFAYYIKKLQLINGKAGFSDHSLPLNFDTNIHSLEAQIDHLSSENRETMVVLSGVVEKYGLANIEAKTMLANFKEKTDVKVNFENLDVRSYSPYSGKFIGQKIADGRLWLNLNYTIENGQLQSSNNIKIKNLTLGDEVESPDALGLPVGLAIALLEDSDGLIELDVPIKGDMDSPQFELGGVIWKTLGNIITNVVKAPFKFLGSLLGIEDDSLGEVTFRYGSTTILAPQKEKLDQLLAMLEKKKNLMLFIEQSFHSVYDEQALRKKKFYAMTQSNDKNALIKSLYLKHFGEKLLQDREKNFQEEALIAELSKELEASIMVGKEELLSLAKTRAEELQAYFLSHKLTLDRIQITQKVVRDDDTDAQEVTLKLELELKE